MIIENTKYGIIPVKSLVGCLCWFWNNKEEQAKIGILADVYEDEEYPEQNTFYELNGGSYKFCCPAEDYEVKFYADKDCTTASKRRCRNAVADAIEEELEEQLDYYADEYENHPTINYVQAALSDNVHCAVLESDRVVDAVKKLLVEM